MEQSERALYVLSGEHQDETIEIVLPHRYAVGSLLNYQALLEDGYDCFVYIEAGTFTSIESLTVRGPREGEVDRPEAYGIFTDQEQTKPLTADERRDVVRLAKHTLEVRMTSIGGAEQLADAVIRLAREVEASRSLHRAMHPSGPAIPWDED